MARYKVENKRQNKKVVTKEEHKNKVSPQKGKKSSDSSSNGGIYYSFMTIVLLLCIIQITISAVLNISKIIAYNAKIKQITNTRDAAQTLNIQLRDNIKNFSNITGLEAIARNNLKMSSEDEIMVIINPPKEEKEEKSSGFSLFKH